MGQNVTGETVGQRCLADPLRPGNQPGMGQAAAFKPLPEISLGVFVADKAGVFPRRRKSSGIKVISAHDNTRFKRFSRTSRID
mgnify:CR=1 FL=1